jgi:transposase
MCGLLGSVDERLKRHALTDDEWAVLEPLLPAHPRQGHRWADHRLIMDGVFHRSRTGCPWRDLPEGFGNWKTVYNRHRRWSLDGTWASILTSLRVDCDGEEGQDWTIGVDSTVVRAHQHSAGARKAAAKDAPVVEALTGG